MVVDVKVDGIRDNIDESWADDEFKQGTGR
jgi:hypothetical protein